MNNQQSSPCLWSRRMLSSTILASFIIFATIAYSVYYSLFQNDETTRWVSIAASIILSVFMVTCCLANTAFGGGECRAGAYKVAA